ncbi:hypothetical protein [Paenisporosarcina indica]|uniref:hypothetical protein n=1 Tax=Paenisporosarcina indica TaxID=650093 RepID=UPI00094F81BE|nr:hypothetical protein [Paenisporosarcina indica]
MRKVHGVKSLIIYLESVNFPLNEERVNELILKREIPHNNPIGNTIIFDLNHIDWWINEKKRT